MIPWDAVLQNTHSTQSHGNYLVLLPWYKFSIMWGDCSWSSTNKLFLYHQSEILSVASLDVKQPFKKVLPTFVCGWKRVLSCLSDSYVLIVTTVISQKNSTHILSSLCLWHVIRCFTWKVLMYLELLAQGLLPIQNPDI